MCRPPGRVGATCVLKAVRAFRFSLGDVEGGSWPTTSPSVGFAELVQDHLDRTSTNVRASRATGLTSRLPSGFFGFPWALVAHRNRIPAPPLSSKNSTSPAFQKSNDRDMARFAETAPGHQCCRQSSSLPWPEPPPPQMAGTRYLAAPHDRCG